MQSSQTTQIQAIRNEYQETIRKSGRNILKKCGARWQQRKRKSSNSPDHPGKYPERVKKEAKEKQSFPRKKKFGWPPGKRKIAAKETAPTQEKYEVPQTVDTDAQMDLGEQTPARNCRRQCSRCQKWLNVKQRHPKALSVSKNTSLEIVNSRKKGDYRRSNCAGSHPAFSGWGGQPHTSGILIFVITRGWTKQDTMRTID